MPQLKGLRQLAAAVASHRNPVSGSKETVSQSACCGKQQVVLSRGMSREIRADYDTQYLFPRSLEEWVEPNDPARFIREFVRQLDLKGLRTEEDERMTADTSGRPHYSFELLLSVWLWGYVNGVRSCRQLERGCRQFVPLMWLAGLHEPDHNTLWRFWKRHKEVLREVFKQSIRVAWEAQLVGMVLHAVDGTKIGARASRRTGLHREDLNRAMQGVEQRIATLEEQIERAGEGGAEPDDRLPEELTKQTALRDKIKNALKELDKHEEDHLHPTDPDARMMVDGRGRTNFSYNAQAVVDEEAGVIVAADVSDHANDEHQLGPMVDQVRENVGKNAETTVADSGYDTAEELDRAEKSGARVVVASKQRLSDVGPYHAWRFAYDELRDQVQCPRGEWLTAAGVVKHKNKPHPLKKYRCRSTSCPVRNECTTDRHGRGIEIGPHHAARERNRLRLTEPSSREALRKRGATVERIFAEIKETLGFRRWTVARIENVKAQWLLVCTAMNLRRMIFA